MLFRSGELVAATTSAGAITSQLHALSTTRVGAQSAITLNKLSTTQIGQFSEDQAHALTSTQLNGLSSADVGALNVTNLTETQIGGLSTAVTSFTTTSDTPEREMIALGYHSADFREGVAAFLAKRAANFTGR